MKTLLLLLIPCVAFAGTEPINVNTTDGHVKATSSGVGPSPKPFNFSDVHTAGILLKEHGDVNITSPTNTQVLTYDSGTSKWKNEDAGGSGGIGTLKDVTVEDNSGFSGGGIPSMANVVTLTPDNNLFELYDGGSDQAVLKLKTVTGAALTKTDDTNITLTLGGSASTSLVNAASLTLGWTGTLSQARGGFGKSTASTTDGQIPIGKTSDGSWNVNTITAGTGISVTNGAGAITIANTGAVSTGNLTDAGTDGLVVTGGTGAVVGSGTSLAQHVSDASHNGYLSSTDWTTFNGHSTVTPAALTRTNDTNVTLTLGGTPTTALLQATSLTLGWTGTLAAGRGGTGVSSLGDLTDAGTDGIVVTGGTGTVITSASLAQHVADASHNGYLSSTDWSTFNGHSTVTPAALTKADDTNVTLTLGGTPATSLLQATSITAGWTGTLAVGRGGTGVGSLGNLTKSDDTNVTLTLGGTPTGALIASASIAAGWTGTLSQARGGFGKSTASTTDGQIPIGKTSDGTWNVNTITQGTGITVTNGAGTITIAATAQAQTHAVTFTVDGSGAVLTTGTKSYTKIPYGGTLTGWLLIGSPSGSVTVDIFRAADGAGLPVTSIIGGSGTKPALSSAVENSSTSFTSWTSTTLTAKDNMAISLSGITTTTYCSLTLYYQ